MRTSRVRRVGALLIGLTLVAAACGGDDDDDDTSGTDPSVASEPTDGSESTDTGSTGGSTDESAPPGSDGTDGGSDAGALEGMKGTTPLVDLADNFKQRLNDFWVQQGNKALVDYNYGAESYDAAVVIALATEIAKTDGIDMAKEIIGVTRDGEKCTDFQGCLELVKANKDIDYDGVSGPMELNGKGDPMVASYGMLHFGADNRIDDAMTEYIEAELPAEADVPPEKITGTREGDGVLTLGALLPDTGSLAFLGPPEFAGVAMAIDDMNKAGGVLGKPVKHVPGDSGDDSTDIASETVDRMLSQNVDAIIGAASSSVSLNVIDKITQAGVVEWSPANTSDQFTDYADRGLYFRNAPPDALQGTVIANQIVQDGNATVYILALDDPYGTGLAEVAEQSLTASGVEVLGKEIYDPKAASYDSEVGAVADEDPDAVLLITFNEGSRILRTMAERGIGPTEKNVYGVDGNMGNALGEDFDAGE